MPILIPNINNIKSKLRRQIEDRTGITNWTDGSIARMLLELPIDYLDDLWESVKSSEESGRLDTAVGDDLDLLGVMFNITRLPAYAATTVGTGPSLKFTNNGSSDASIPAGTRVWPSESSERSFLTTSALLVPAGGEAYAEIRADGVGSYYNVGPSTIDSHNLPLSNIQVTNVLPISNGEFRESDDHYRARISKAISVLEGGTEAAIREACLGIPGVRDVIINRYARGARTMEIMILSIGPTTSSMLGAAQVAVDEVLAFGIDAEVVAPTEREVDVVATVRLNSRAAVVDVRNAVTSAIAGYIDNLPIETGYGEGTLYFNELLSRVMDASPYIEDANLLIRIDGQPVLQTNQQPLAGERFITHNISMR